MDQPAVPPKVTEHLAASTTRHAVAIQQHVLRAARGFLAGEGFTELLPPTIGPETDPGVRGATQLEVDFYGHRYKMMTSAILYKQASLLGFEKVFFIAPNVRAEPLESTVTHRHLVEFHQIDVEMVHASREEAMALAEGLLRHVIRTIVDQAADRLAELRREVALLRGYLDRPFELATHRRVVADLHSIGHPQQNDVEIDWPGEELISSKASGPFFIVDYPLGSRGFYDRESREQPGVLRNFDLIAPEGFGELASGGEREYEYDRIVEGMRRTGEDPEQFRWYLEFVEAGCPPSAGFGLGLERLMRFLTGLDEIWRVTAFPRVPGRVGL